MMKIITGARNSGKSSALVKLSAKTGATIVSMAPDYIRDLADQMGLTIPEPLHPNDLKENKPSKIYIDEIGSIMQYLIGADVGVATMDEFYVRPVQDYH